MEKALSFILFITIFLFTSFFSISPAKAEEFIGEVQFHKDITFECKFSIELNYSMGPGKALVLIGSPEEICDLLEIDSNLHDYSLAGNVLTIYNVNIRTVTLGGCYGDLVGIITNHPDGSKDLYIDAELAPITGTSPCYISGILHKS